MTLIDKPVIVALDFSTAAAALALVTKLDPALCRVKVGKELFTAAGPKLVEVLVTRGFDVFLDLKFHDIPNTVASACKAAASLGVWMVNVHASGGRKMLLAAREAIDNTATTKPLLIGVTVLTSLADEDMQEIGFSGSAASNVERLAALAKHCGLDGVVCSAQETPLLRALKANPIPSPSPASGEESKMKSFLQNDLRASSGAGFKLVTPGIRLAEDAAGDQARVVTPTEAIKMGADYLVIGRSITQALDPIATLTKINNDLQMMRT